MKVLLRLLFWGFCVYPVMAFISIKFFNTEIDRIFGSLSLLTALAVLAFNIYHRRKTKFPLYLLFFFLFSCYVTVMNYFTNSYIIYEVSFLRYVFLNININLVYILFIIENARFDDAGIKLGEKFFYAIFVFALIGILIQYLQDPYFFAREELLNKIKFLDTRKRLTSIFSYISLNSYGISFPFIFAYVLYATTNKKIHIPCMGAGLLYGLLTQTRYVIISILVITVIYILKNRRNLRQYFIVASLFLFLVFNFGQDLFNFRKFIDNRIFEKDARNFQSSSTYGRVLSYYAFLTAFPEEPVWGQGEELTPRLKRYMGDIPVIHIGYLHYLYAFGLAGMSMFFTAYFLFIKRLYGLGKITGNYSVLIGLVVYLMANVTFVFFRLFDFGFIVSFIILMHQYNKLQGLSTFIRTNAKPVLPDDKMGPQTQLN